MAALPRQASAAAELTRRRAREPPIPGEPTIGPDVISKATVRGFLARLGAECGIEDVVTRLYRTGISAPSST